MSVIWLAYAFYLLIVQQMVNIELKVSEVNIFTLLHLVNIAWMRVLILISLKIYE